MLILHIFMLAAGLIILPVGFYANYEAKSPGISSADFALIGLCLAILGTLLICVPNFFKGNPCHSQSSCHIRYLLMAMLNQDSFDLHDSMI